MENSQSPLQKYKRQPKILLDLPSQGKYTPPGTTYENKTEELKVFSMTPNDEILFKTPDALINGEATIATIKSCVPEILDPWKIPTLDVDSILVAIRIATYGDNMTVNHKCKSCNADNSYDISLRLYLQSYSSREFVDVTSLDDFIFTIRPLNYKEYTEFQKTSIALRRSLSSILNRKMEDSEKEKLLDPIYKQIAENSLRIILQNIESISVDGETETDKLAIKTFFDDNDVSYFQTIKDLIEKNAQAYEPPTHNIICTECQKEDSIRVTLDQSDFFAKG